MNFIRLFIGLIISFLVVLNAAALSTDREQPADIEADNIEFDFKKGIRTYEGNVLAVQGTLRLVADKLIANFKDGELQNATTWGSLARFQQRPDGKEHNVEGWAKKIFVNQKTNTLTLSGKAALKQGGDIARGETIIYNMANDTLKVKGAAKVGTAGKSGAQSKAAKGASSTATNTKPEAGRAPVDDKSINNPKESDPFLDNSQGPAETPGSGGTVIQSAPSGRSRLIIQPK